MPELRILKMRLNRPRPKNRTSPPPTTKLAALALSLLFSAAPCYSLNAKSEPTPIATTFNITTNDKSVVARGFVQSLAKTNTRIGLYIHCNRDSGTFEAILAFGPFPHAKTVQAAVRRANGAVERFGPVITATPAHGFHSPKLTDKTEVLRLIDAALEHGALLSNGHNSIWNRIPASANRKAAAALKQCAGIPDP